ncbi:MAG: PilZ domain-containing protein [Magnetococcales bacterium]|nr:PilZ domain-containing protein [Magnetococcales bacterium]
MTASGNQREWERISYNHPEVVLKMDRRRVYKGITSDVSLGGLFVKTQTPPRDIEQGEEGTLIFVSHKGKETQFPCETIRISEGGIAIQFLDSRAAFGISLVQEIFEGFQEKHDETRGNIKNRYKSK